MNIKNISQKVATFVEELLQEELNNEVVNDQMSEDYKNKIDEELSAFENGIDDDEPIVEIEESDINDQTAKFLSLRDKR